MSNAAWLQLREDVTRYRYGDEQHLDESLGKIFLFNRVSLLLLQHCNTQTSRMFFCQHPVGTHMSNGFAPRIHKASLGRHAGGTTQDLHCIVLHTHACKLWLDLDPREDCHVPFCQHRRMCT